MAKTKTKTILAAIWGKIVRSLAGRGSNVGKPGNITLKKFPAQSGGKKQK